ncbi:conserved hypothetical protein [Perkinsus marinus ATCC 50983]|uniref:AD domain-containing protein n=1 Tax=Perkinsus marinus (strain ATCC 50983 / TXsc) TaxID=423536 RepID=C5LQQ4_PERM5|nr:conserved hypothetical protein [Perkinsus marinus ATCC 50983]EER00789.1 conserved hypothetical protein [Perkinsus marinus ATCC 50983]|eukprot:XP_002768071.1 conserved hypothetical protein [Perkinsus marinus ATCC 50983]
MAASTASMASGGPMSPGQNFLGCSISVKTTNGDTFRGELFCYDISDSNSIVLRELVGKDKCTYHWIKTNTIRDIKALKPPTATDSPLPHIDLKALQAQMTDAEHNFQDTRERYGVGVTQLAQTVFDLMSKTMPCRWDGQDILCYTVRIKSPYQAANCTGPNSSELDRVKKVLELERFKMEKEEKKHS